MASCKISTSVCLAIQKVKSMISQFVYRLKIILHFMVRFQFLRVKVQDVSFNVSSQYLIPNNVIQTSATKRVPLLLHRDVIRLREINEDFNFQTFDNIDMEHWMKTNFAGTQILQAFLGSRFGVMKSDIFRYCYIYNNGGISLDLTKGLSDSLKNKFCDKHSLLVLTQERQKMSQNLKLREWFLQQELDPNLFVSWCFAATPRHPALLCVIKNVESNFLKMVNLEYVAVKEAIWKATGPIAFNEGLIEHFSNKGMQNVKILGKDFDEANWPKFKSSSYLNTFRRHYTEIYNSRIWNNVNI